MDFASIRSAVRKGKRISPDEGLWLLREVPLLDLADLATDARYSHNPATRVTFVMDTRPHYTNVCENDCAFCSFYCHAGEKGAYVASINELIRKFRVAAENGTTVVLLQGGVNPALSFDYYLQLVKRTVAEVPEVHPHFFSPPEIIGMSRLTDTPVSDVLRDLWDAGLRTLPGGGADILSDRVRRRISPRKGTASDWISVMREAHRMGYKSAATMMYGHLENEEDIIAHLESIRKLQDEHYGFIAFVPWSFKPDNSPLGRTVSLRATPNRYLQMIAIARIYLDNFDHIQASWCAEGRKIGQIALHFGADDLGGTLREDGNPAAAKVLNRANLKECVQIIHANGFDAAERTALYDIKKVYRRKKRA